MAAGAMPKTVARLSGSRATQLKNIVDAAKTKELDIKSLSAEIAELMKGIKFSELECFYKNKGLIKATLKRLSEENGVPRLFDVIQEKLLQEIYIEELNNRLVEEVDAQTAVHIETLKRMRSKPAEFESGGGSAGGSASTVWQSKKKARFVDAEPSADS